LVTTRLIPHPIQAYPFPGFPGVLSPVPYPWGRPCDRRELCADRGCHRVSGREPSTRRHSCVRGVPDRQSALPRTTPARSVPSLQPRLGQLLYFALSVVLK
jgi:hypothetical protein